MIRILQIDEKAKEAILKLKTYAENHKVNLEIIKQMASGIKQPVGDDSNFSCYLHDGFRIVYSIEEQPAGLFRHISISIDDLEKLPNVFATETIINEFGFKGTISNCDSVWIEENVPVITVGFVKAINLIQKI
jgi:hypothetical protein